MIKTKTNNRVQIGGIFINEWVDHFKTLLEESRPEYLRSYKKKEGSEFNHTTQENFEKISRVKTIKSPGPGGILPELIKCRPPKLFEI